jgi:lactoylglutathione lyase
MSALEFDHIAIHVADMQKSAGFYEEILGLERLLEPFHDGLHIWYRIGPHTSLHVIGCAAAASEHPIDCHFAFRVHSLDDFMLHLDAAHVAYRNFNGDGRINVRRDGVRQIYFQDPDGYWIEVNEAKAC